MQEYRQLSRSDRYKKRRKMKQSIFMFTALGVLFFIILFSLIIFGHKEPTESLVQDDNETSTINEPKNKEDETTNENSDNLIAEEETNKRDEYIDKEQLLKEADVQQVDSADENVIVAYSGNWPPIGTTQIGEHVTDYSNGSVDRIEIKRAVSLVTNIAEDDMIEHWVGNDGEQKVHATVEQKSTQHFYRVYLSWIDGEGWQPTLVERLKENDKP